MALGAGLVRLWREVFWTGAEPVLYGAIAGVFMAAASSTFIEASLFGIHATDLTTYVAAVIGLVGSALIAISLAGRKLTSLAVGEILRRD